MSEDQDPAARVSLTVNERDLDELAGQLTRWLTDKVGVMAPTVERVANVVTTARVLGGIGRISLWIAPIVVGALYWMHDRWAILGQLFKRSG